MNLRKPKEKAVGKYVYKCHIAVVAKSNRSAATAHVYSYKEHVKLESPWKSVKEEEQLELSCRVVGCNWSKY